MGWINLKDTTKAFKNTHIVVEKQTIATSLPKIQSSFKFYLPLCSLLKVEKTINEFSKIQFNNEDVYVPSSHIQKLEVKTNDWVAIAQKCVNSPYKWGGRNASGIDCSALVQLSLITKKIYVPRDTSDQLNYFSHLFPESRGLTRGSLVYWKGHVGIGVDNLKIIHSSGHHFKVVIEEYDEVMKRLKKKGLKVKKIINLKT